MSGRVNGAGDRIHDLEAARRGGPRSQQRRLSLGSAECRAGVVRWSPTERYLVGFSTLLRLPTKSRQLGKLYRLLLELNH